MVILQLGAIGYYPLRSCWLSNPTVRKN